MYEITIALLIVGLIILFIYFCKIAYRCQFYEIAVINTNIQLDMVRLDKTSFNNGDIILFMYDCSQCSRKEFINMIITCNPWPSIFSHIGIVVKIDGVEYIAHKTYCEEFDINKKCIINKSGLYPLRKYLKEYKGYVYHSRIAQSIEADKIIPKIYEYNSREFVVDKTTVFDYLLMTDIRNRENKTMSCSGYVRDILVDVGLLKSMNGNHTTPGGVYNEIIETGIYAKPTIIMNDSLNYLCIKRINM